MSQTLLFKPGDRINDFVIVRELGRGGMGCVYLADEKYRKVAIKVLLPDLLDAEGEARFEREIGNLIRLEGLSGIPIVYSHGTRPMPFLAMQYVEGRDLGKYAEERRTLPEPERIEGLARVMEEVCRIVDSAHRKNVVHRDIKPANILVSTAGDRPFVLDFGIAKCVLDTRLTRGPQGPGTVPYQAPEQIEEERTAVGREHLIDVWALGVVFYKLLTRELPFSAKTPFQIQKMILDETPRSPRSLNPAIPPALEDLVVDCLSKDANKRPQSMSDVSERIRALYPSSRVPQKAKTRQPAPEIWYAPVAVEPDPAVVSDPELRRRLAESSLPWRVRDRGSGLEMLLVPPGAYERGTAASAEGEEDERPAHRVAITKPFYLGVHPVTQEEYLRVAGKNPSKFAGDERRPVERVSWEEASAFCSRCRLRLPTEAEWEFACRAGSTGVRYGPLDQIAWFVGNSGGRTHGVGSKSPNPLGFHDLLGNVFEWCASWYDPQEYARSATGATDPQGSERGDRRVIRGGGWNFPERSLRGSARNKSRPERAEAFIGFRVARSP
jgi:eukaryotic-like serine/threonine-protein kinase